MNKRVVVAIDLQEPLLGSVSYAINLAGRLQASLVLLAVAPATGCGPPGVDTLTSTGLSEHQKQWLNHAMKLARNQGVRPELFQAAGPFPQALLEFLRSRTDVQFLVIGLGDTASEFSRNPLASTLPRLRQVFPGEILLVQEQGRISHLPELPIKPQGRES